MNLKKRGFVLAARRDFDQELIELYDRLSGVGWGEYPLDERLRRYELTEGEREGDVLFPLIPAYESLCYRFGVLGHAFRARGYRPVVLYDDFDLPARPEFTVNSTDRLQAVKYRYRARTFADQFGFESVPISEFAEPAQYDRLVRNASDGVSYRGVLLSGCAKASTRKYLKRYSLDLSDPDIRSQYEQFFRGAAMLADASKGVFDEYDIAATVVNEANYIQGFVPLAVSSNAGVPTYSDGWGYRNGHLIFGNTANRNYMGQFAAQDVVEAALNTELTAEESEEVETIISQWRNNEVSSIDYANRTGKSADTDANVLVGLFTNLLWDGALEPDQALYDDVYEWLADTIDIIGDQSDTHLVIKPHPAEHLRGTNESVRDWVRAEYDTLPENVTLLPPDTEIDTYALFDDLDLGLVYASTVGLEMVCDRLPVVTSGYPPYHGFEITYDPDTKAEYREFVEQPGNHDCSAERRARARRYFHFLFFCKHFEFPYYGGASFDGKTSQTVEIRHDDLTPGNEPWDSIVTQILAGEEVLQSDCQKLK
jgi:hypothetical protein